MTGDFTLEPDAPCRLLSRWLNETEPLPEPDRDRPLNEVRNDFGGRLRPSGQDGEIDEWSIYDEGFRRLVQWAEETGCFFEGLQPLKEGGREHDLTFIEESRTWLKFTKPKPAAAGYLVSFDVGMPSLEPDLRPANVVRTADGLIIPIDSIPVRLDNVGKSILSP